MSTAIALQSAPGDNDIWPGSTFSWVTQQGGMRGLVEMDALTNDACDVAERMI
ncbi:MAG: hypothetical protein KDA60_21925 [Planctomycetales bacterium]|nr:hypothetical protein [Planctomycetales bacterium]